jgi:hypothetical protein
MSAAPHQARPSPGPWSINTSGMNSTVYLLLDRAGRVIGFPHRDIGGKQEHEFAANAALIAEAGTVFHETGLTPRQLAEQRAELLAALIAIRDAGRDWHGWHEMYYDAIELARAALAKAEKGGSHD